MYAMLGYGVQKVVKKKLGQPLFPTKSTPYILKDRKVDLVLPIPYLHFTLKNLAIPVYNEICQTQPVRRSFAIAFAYSLLSYQSVREGLDRIIPNTIHMEEGFGRAF